MKISRKIIHTNFFEIKIDDMQINECNKIIFHCIKADITSAEDGSV